MSSVGDGLVDAVHRMDAMHEAKVNGDRPRVLGELGPQPTTLVGPEADAFARFSRACAGLKDAQTAFNTAQVEYREALEVMSQVAEKRGRT